MCAFPAGVSRKDYNEWRKRQEFLKTPKDEITIHNYVKSIGGQPLIKVFEKELGGENAEESDEDNPSKIVPVGKYYGLQFTKRSIDIFELKQDGAWKDLNSHYSATHLEVVLNVVAKLLLNRKIVEAGHMKELAKMVKEVGEEIRLDFGLKLIGSEPGTDTNGGSNGEA